MLEVRQLSPDDRLELEKSYAFRYQAYVSLDYIKPSSCPNGLEIDEYDRYSDAFLAYENEKIVGMARLIKDSPIGLQIENVYEFEEIEKPACLKEEIVEISRLITEKRAGLNILWAIFGALYRYASQQNLKYAYAFMDERHVNALEKIGFTLRRLTVKEFKGNTHMAGYFQNKKAIPFILDLKKFPPSIQQKLLA